MGLIRIEFRGHRGQPSFREASDYANQREGTKGQVKNTARRLIFLKMIESRSSVPALSLLRPKKASRPPGWVSLPSRHFCDVAVLRRRARQRADGPDRVRRPRAVTWMR